MFIRKVSARNFGPFESIVVEFRPTGLNVIQGRNASGKTQLAGAILSSIVGRAALRLDQSGISPCSAIVVLGEEDFTETVSLIISSDQSNRPSVKQSVVSETPDKTARHLNIRLLSAISDTDGPSFLLDFESGKMELSASDIHQLNSLIPKHLQSSPCWKELCEIKGLHSSAKSEGQRQIAQLVRELIVRKRTPSNIPLLIDDNLWALDNQWREYIFALISEISKSTQVLLFTTDTTFSTELIVASLDSLQPSGLNLASYNRILARQTARTSLRPAAKYVKGQRYPSQENRTCELKEVKGKNPVSSIKSLVDQYVVAFLNAGEPQAGKILWGVRDEDLVVVGVTLSDSECDELRRVVTEKLHQITPAIAPTAYRIELHSISDGTKLISDLYIVEVRVPSSRRTLLYATGNQEVYVKTDAGKKKLNTIEIQQELLRRCGIEAIF